MRIGEVAKLTGHTNYTLRYYEKEGLIRNIKRDESGLRYYTKEDVEIIKSIDCLKKTGMSIKKIKEYIDIFYEKENTYNERIKLFKLQREGILKKMEELQSNLEMAEYKIWYYENMPVLGDEEDPLNCEKMRAIYEKINKEE